MSLLDDLQAKADLNGDGKLSVEDLEKLKGLADQNGDGKIDFEDAKSFNFDNVVDVVKDKLSGIFGGK